MEEDIHVKRQPQWILLCATMALAISLSLCFAQGNREAQLVTAPPEIAPQLPCDSLDPKVCFDIYLRRIERMPPPILSDQHDNAERCLMAPPWPGEGISQLAAPPTTRTLEPFGYYPEQFGFPKQDVCRSRLTRIR
jgi:hypothetical protein